MKHALTFLIGCLYAAIVTLITSRYPRLPSSAGLVVIGNLLIAGYLHATHGASVTRSFLVANILLGAPQIVAYHARTAIELAQQINEYMEAD